jgi:membrane-bound lytic murein transglycosylase D
MKYETVHYVPKFLAASWVLSQPRRFGVDCWPDVIEWTAIPLERQVSLDLLAEEADVDEELLRRLNSELLIGISPADRNYRLKVPAAQLPQIREVLQREDGRLLRYHYYVIRQGDTLSALAKHYDVSVNLIEEHNPGISNRYLKIGETILIPAIHGRVENARLPPAPRAPVNLSFEGTHVVRRGETLWSLGIKYGVDPQALAEANNMELNQILPEGKVLKVPIIE